MKLTKQKNESGISIYLEEEDKYLGFSFGGNGDLYWHLHKKSKTDNTFTITKENYPLFSLFEELYRKIEDIEIFDEEDELPFYIDTEEDYREYLQRKERERQEELERYQLYNRSYYNNLFDEERKTITWYSDETAQEVANYLKIVKEEETFKIEFHTQPHIGGYDRDFGSSSYIPVRFRNSGSRYDPFNIVFMKMYNKLKEVDDVLDEGHQLHMEEYLYTKRLIKKP